MPIIEYHVTVDDVKEKGHPIQKIEMRLDLASAAVDYYHKKYPQHTVRMFALERKEIKQFKGQSKE